VRARLERSTATTLPTGVRRLPHARVATDGDPAASSEIGPQAGHSRDAAVLAEHHSRARYPDQLHGGGRREQRVHHGGEHPGDPASSRRAPGRRRFPAARRHREEDDLN
jgi:hypothetical protein